MSAGALGDNKGRPQTVSRPLVAITGLGCVTSLGQGVTDTWDALAAGRSGIKPITRFSTDGLGTTIAGCVDFLSSEPYSAYELSLAMARASATEAIAQAGIGSPAAFPGPLMIATPPAEFEWQHLSALDRLSLKALAVEDGSASVPGDDVRETTQGYKRLLEAARNNDLEHLYPLFQFAGIGESLAAEFGVRGQPVAVCTACASGATAITLGTEAIRSGHTDAALCIGTDATVHPEAMIRFSLLSAMSTRNDPPHAAPKPFAKDRDGFIIGEGAAALVLESYEAAKVRGAKILGFVAGCGEKADDFHRTRSNPDGRAMIGAIANTLADAGLTPDQIDYVNAHGTSTAENDKMEYLSLHAVFGDAIHSTPVSSTKSIAGHNLIAAGAVEAVFSVMTMQTGRIPPTLNYDIPDPAIPLDVVPGVYRDMPVNRVLSNSFGFGGQNACLVFSNEPD